LVAIVRGVLLVSRTFAEPVVLSRLPIDGAEEAFDDGLEIRRCGSALAEPASLALGFHD
jgi:hypothetical protein